MDLHKAIKKRDELKDVIQQLKFRREAAEKRLEKVESQIRSLEVEPEDLPHVIEDLRAEFEEKSSKFVEDVLALEEALKPYMEKL